MRDFITKGDLFGELDLKKIKDNPEFKEDSVREVIILPIIKALGYSEDNIVRSKTLQHPFLKIGSQKRSVNLIPDYVIRIHQNYVWVLDAKAPNQKIINNNNVEQVYSYAAHPEIRSNYFCLCNGIEFAVFKTTDTNKPLLYFEIEEIESHWEILKHLLSADSFQSGKKISYTNYSYSISPKPDFDYATRPLLEGIPVHKQAAKRHFGCNAYFTRQSWDIVNKYIRHFSQPGDLVLDPFAGSGVTAVEALMNNRRAICLDINPMSVFIIDSLLAPIVQEEFIQAIEEIKNEFIKKVPLTEEKILKTIKRYPGPKQLLLPKGSDVESVAQLFTPKQTADLSLLKYLIKKQKNINIQKSLMLAFYNTLTVCNLTFHDTPQGGGNHFGFYYRYRMAKTPSFKDTIQVFENKCKRISDGKKEMEYFINENTVQNAQIIKGSATDLSFLPKESVDYIYTDPPYGKKIQYLDLSVMWNAWLDLEVNEEDYKLEAIEGGTFDKSKNDYNELISQSIREMYRVLKFDRWLSFVFAHKDPEFWHLIINTAEECGFEYLGAVPQKNGQTSFKKRQNPFTVLSGQLIINFRKVKSPKAIMKANLGMDITEIVLQTIEGIIAKNEGASLEQINDELIIKGLELGFLDLLKKQYSDLTPVLLSHFDYNEESERFTLKKNAKFKTQVDEKLRIKYYLLSFLRRKEREKKDTTFDEIILEILPLLKNGNTPEDQTILGVLEDLAEHTSENTWRLRKEGQQSLF